MMGLVGEFKFFSEFGWAENGATDWKQTKAGNRNHQRKLFQTESPEFLNQMTRRPTTAQKRKDDPSPEEPESSLFSVSKLSTSIS
ncbi:hypothetical protein [Acetobacterium sp. UBA5834]|jgi:hypothetical protein|uniref:hypothetical protein n=1 Tax=Acetobacterium sp. UBA5834 TaxID=1945907 RepID=UPI00257B0229|nr:hypothetical protein [Acetobacterium sp. UBA5834]